MEREIGGAKALNFPAFHPPVSPQCLPLVETSKSLQTLEPGKPNLQGSAPLEYRAEQEKREKGV